MRKPRRDEAPDLQTQYEQLLDQVWDSERRERMNDRIDALARADQARPHHHKSKER